MKSQYGDCYFCGGEVLELRGFINAEIDTGVVEFRVMSDRIAEQDIL